VKGTSVPQGTWAELKHVPEPDALSVMVQSAPLTPGVVTTTDPDGVPL